MILWTIERLENIFPEKAPKTALRKVKGGFLEGTDSADGFTVGRLISTDPSLYLREDYAPGFLRK